MRMILLSFICLISNTVFTSCKSNKYETETIEFKTFLKSQFNSELIDGTYLLVPSSQCKSCIFIDAKTDGQFSGSIDSIYLISSIDTNAFLNFKTKYYDEGDALMKLSFIKYSNQIVVIEDKKIVKIVPYKK